METIGLITLILLCALALTFIVLELGPMIDIEVTSWKLRKQKALEAKEEKANFKKEMKNLKREAKKLKFMKKTGLIIPNDLYEEEVNNTINDTTIINEELLNIDEDSVSEDSIIDEENAPSLENIISDVSSEEETTYMPTEEELNSFEPNISNVDNDKEIVIEETPIISNVENTQIVEEEKKEEPIVVSVKKIRSKKKNNE